MHVSIGRYGPSAVGLSWGFVRCRPEQGLMHHTSHTPTLVGPAATEEPDRHPTRRGARSATSPPRRCVQRIERSLDRPKITDIDILKCSFPYCGHPMQRSPHVNAPLSTIAGTAPDRSATAETTNGGDEEMGPRGGSGLRASASCRLHLCLEWRQEIRGGLG